MLKEEKRNKQRDAGERARQSGNNAENLRRYFFAPVPGTDFIPVISSEIEKDKSNDEQ